MIRSLAALLAGVTLGGKLLTPIKEMAPQGRYCVIQDPAGAVAALFQAGA